MGWTGRVRRALRSTVRGLALAAVSILAGVPLLVAAVVSIGLIPVGAGLLLTPVSLSGVRALAGWRRRTAGQWSGVRIDPPYRPAVSPPPDGRRRMGPAATTIALLRDPATWRDLLWLVVNAPVGVVLGVLPASLLGNGLLGILVAPWIWAFSPEPSLYWPISIPIGVAAWLLLTFVAGPILRRHAAFSAALLAPTGRDVAARLTESRAQVRDSSAAELRRIERDLHDGAQARLVALGLNIGLAEQLVRADPDTALALLAEARESSGQALSELRGLVRGIHPPVLAERGLDVAVRALAAALPLPVEVTGVVPRLPAPVEAAAYFAVAEALANVVKHSSAAHAEVRLRVAGTVLVASIHDDGTGGAGVGMSGGLPGIQRRLAAFDGTVHVTSPAGGPTVVTLELPCAP
jgi:signal transduction histidine kinase